MGFFRRLFCFVFGHYKDPVYTERRVTVAVGNGSGRRDIIVPTLICKRCRLPI